ncbi:MAG TPA: hypothetical protein VN154_01710 [Rhizomicrobium sp.]|nr:hypothetical protein [Rhizomicrobium sp.]
MNVRAVLAAICAASVLAGPNAGARQWNPTPSARALDYLQIIDNRPTRELILVWWVAPPMMEQSSAAKDLLDKYVVLAVADAHIDVGGSATYAEGSPQLQDNSGVTLKPVGDADMPPALSGTMVTLRSMMAQMLGNMGKGMQLLAYEGGALHACSKGRLSVLYSGATYTYDTPIPGCEGN